MEPVDSSAQATPRAHSSVWTTGVKGGLGTGAFLFLFTLVFQYILGYFIEWWIMLTSLVAYVIGIALTHQAYKNESGGFMSYGKGLLLGIVLGVAAGLLMGLLSYFYINFIDPTVVEKQADDLLKFQVSMMESFGAGDAEIDKLYDNAASQKQEFIASAKDFLGTVGGQIASSFGFAFFLSLIVAAFTKRKDPQVEY